MIVAENYDIFFQFISKITLVLQNLSTKIQSWQGKGFKIKINPINYLLT